MAGPLKLKERGGRFGNEKAIRRGSSFGNVELAADWKVSGRQGKKSDSVGLIGESSQSQGIRAVPRIPLPTNKTKSPSL